MGKCLLKHPETGIKCQRFILDCLLTGNHAGRRYHPKTRETPAYFENLAWRFSLTVANTAGVFWQTAIRREIKRLTYLRRYSREKADRDELLSDIRYLRQYLVKEKRNARGVVSMTHKVDGIARVVGQGTLREYEP